MHHLRGHIAALYLTHPELEPPFFYASLPAAGTAIFVRVQDYEPYFEVLGRTVDDAAGEAFDKVRTLGLGYRRPGGEPGRPNGRFQSLSLPTPHVEGPYNVSFLRSEKQLCSIL